MTGLKQNGKKTAKSETKKLQTTIKRLLNVTKNSDFLKVKDFCTILLNLRHSSWHAKSTIQSKQANGVISFYIWEEPLMPQQIFTARLEGFSFKNISKQFTKKHEPYETQFISFLHSKPPLACTGDESYKLSVTSALPWNQTKSQ